MAWGLDRWITCSSRVHLEVQVDIFVACCHISFGDYFGMLQELPIAGLSFKIGF